MRCSYGKAFALKCRREWKECRFKNFQMGEDNGKRPQKSPPISSPIILPTRSQISPPIRLSIRLPIRAPISPPISGKMFHLVQAEAVFVKVQDSFFLHFCQFFGQRAAFYVQIVGHLLAVEGYKEFFVSVFSRFCG